MSLIETIDVERRVQNSRLERAGASCGVREIEMASRRLSFLGPCIGAYVTGPQRCDVLSGQRRGGPAERTVARPAVQTAAFRDPHKTLDEFDFNFNPKMNRSLVFDFARCAFIGNREDA